MAIKVGDAADRAVARLDAAADHFGARAQARLVGERRTLRNLLARELDADVAAVQRALAVDRDRRDQIFRAGLRAGNPAPRVDQEVAHVPVLVVEVEVVDRPDPAVLGMDRVALQVLDLVEHVGIPEQALRLRG